MTKQQVDNKCSFILAGKHCKKKAEYEIIYDFESGHGIDQSCACHIGEFLRHDVDEFTILRI